MWLACILRVVYLPYMEENCLLIKPQPYLMKFTIDFRDLHLKRNIAENAIFLCFASLSLWNGKLLLVANVYVSLAPWLICLFGTALNRVRSFSWQTCCTQLTEGNGEVSLIWEVQGLEKGLGIRVIASTARVLQQIRACENARQHGLTMDARITNTIFFYGLCTE